MTGIAALAKAESMAKYAQCQGAPLETFVIALTDQEAFEVLDRYVAVEVVPDSVQFQLDLQAAHKRGDPWPVLAHFSLYGMSIVRALDLH